MVELINPAAEFHRKNVRRSAGLPTMSRKRVALLSNGKWNAGALLEELATLLEEHEVVVAVRDAKRHYNHDIAVDVRDEIASTADFALLAIGD